MADLGNKNFSNVIEIGDNHIKYYNEILKISNISRTWIFRFQNIEKRNFEKAVLAYEEAKDRYEENKSIERKESIRNNVLAILVLFLFAIFAFSSKSTVIGFLLLGILGFFAYRVYQAYNMDIEYPKLPPKERPFPDKFGLGIEMNSGYMTTFTAIGDDGARALRELQNEIDNADIHMSPTIFNMNDYNVTVENNEGVISTGDYAKNTMYETEKEDLWTQ